MENNDAKVTVVQELKLSTNKNLSIIPTAPCIRKDRAHKQGGCLLLTTTTSYNSEKSQPKTNDTTLELEATAITSVLWSRRDHTLINIYIPPSTCCSPQYQANTAHLLSTIGVL